MIKSKYEFVEHINIVLLELNVVSWDSKKPKYDLRYWKLVDDKKLSLKELKFQHKYAIIFLLPPLDWYRKGVSIWKFLYPF